MNNNKIDTLADLQSELGALESLETVYLEGNPVQQAEGAAYRRKIQLALPRLTQIDATYDISSLPCSSSLTDYVMSSMTRHSVA